MSDPRHRIERFAEWSLEETAALNKYESAYETATNGITSLIARCGQLPTRRDANQETLAIRMAIEPIMDRVLAELDARANLLVTWNRRAALPGVEKLRDMVILAGVPANLADYIPVLERLRDALWPRGYDAGDVDSVARYTKGTAEKPVPHGLGHSMPPSTEGWDDRNAATFMIAEKSRKVNERAELAAMVRMSEVPAFSDPAYPGLVETLDDLVRESVANFVHSTCSPVIGDHGTACDLGIAQVKRARPVDNPDPDAVAEQISKVRNKCVEDCRRALVLHADRFWVNMEESLLLRLKNIQSHPNLGGFLFTSVVIKYRQILAARLESEITLTFWGNHRIQWFYYDGAIHDDPGNWESGDTALLAASGGPAPH
jgi:hypothetical protein